MIQEERTFNGVGLNDKIAERSAIRKQVDILEGIYAINADKIVLFISILSYLFISKHTRKSI